MAAPILTAYLDAAPAPRVEVFFPSLEPGTATVTVYRLAGGREFQMRGAVKAATAGTLTRIDLEVPFNMPVTYRAEQFGATGQSLGFTATGTIIVPSSDTWMHNPLDPQGSIAVSLGGETARVIRRPTPGVVSRPRGRKVGVVLSEPRQGVTGIAIEVRTSNDDDADSVQAMFGDDGMPAVVCLRLGERDGKMRVPQPLFLSVLDVPEVDLNRQWGGYEISHPIEGDEVAPPVPGLFVPVLRAMDINVSFATAALVNSSHLTAADVNRRYDLAGAAG